MVLKPKKITFLSCNKTEVPVSPFFGAEFGAVDATEGSQKLFWSCERSTDAVLTL